MKNLVSYLISIIISVLYMYYLDEESGLVITAILITAPLISFAITFLNLKITEISARTSTDVISCGESLELIVDIKRKFPIISPIIIIDFEISANFAQFPTFALKFSPQMKSKSQKLLRLDSKYPTSGKISVKAIRFSDFLGIFALKAKSELAEFDVAVVPQIVPSTNENALFSSLSANLSYDDEQEITTNAYSMHTTPGYEHREYVESDPLKRINWKLSSKLGKLMIRLDDAVCASKPIFIIDLTAKDEISAIKSTEFAEQKIILSQSLYSRANKLIGNVLGTLSYFAANGIECKVYCTGLKDPVICSNSVDVSVLAVAIAQQSIDSLTNTKFEDAVEGIDNDSNLVYCSFSRNPNILRLLQVCKATGANASILLATRESNVDFSGIPTYYYDSNNALRPY